MKRPLTLFDQVFTRLRQVNARTENRIWVIASWQTDGKADLNILSGFAISRFTLQLSNPDQLTSCLNEILDFAKESGKIPAGSTLFFAISSPFTDDMPVLAEGKNPTGFPVEIGGQDFRIPAIEITDFPGSDQTGLTIDAIFPLSLFIWKQIAGELEKESASVWVTPSSVYLASKPFYSDLPQLDVLPLDRKMAGAEKSEIESFIVSQRWLESLVQDGGEAVELNWLEDLGENAFAWTHFLDLKGAWKNGLISESAHRKLAVQQFKTSLLWSGAVSAVLLLGFFIWSNLLAGKAEESWDWRRLHQTELTELNHLELQVKNRDTWYGRQPVAGFRLADIALFSHGLTEAIRISEMKLNDGRPAVNRIIGYSDSETDITRYVSALNGQPVVKSASLIRLEPVSKKNEQELAKAGKFRLIFTVDLEIRNERN